MSTPVSSVPNLISADDLYLFNQGTHRRIYDRLGAHLVTGPGGPGAHFAVWAPSASSVRVIGDFNHWDPEQHELRPLGSSGVWQGFIPHVGDGTRYKYHILSRDGREAFQKADPLAAYAEIAPRTASVVWDLGYTWSDDEWMRQRARRQSLDAPMSIYEVHLGSWRRHLEDGFRSLHYREMAEELARYVKDLGFTHVELLPVMEHPFFGSWGYQVTGFFAPSSRYGTPQEFMEFVDIFHRHGVGVILDWVPAHFPNDPHGLCLFDGTYLYEHADPRQGYHPEWGSCIFNFGRHEVVSFLVSSALFWLDKYHIDGLRVDAVASMLYLDYGRGDGEWIPNVYGGRENLEAVAFLRQLNEAVYADYPDVQTFAEESTAWPGVSRPTHVGGLGFGLKWDMGWMHDTLRYMVRDPVHRKFHHHELPFRMVYAFAENFTLPLSHDEVVYGKRSLLAKMPGDDWQKFANLRLLYGYMYGLPGKKLLFMGGEFAQWQEWQHDGELDWRLLNFERHAAMVRWIRDLNVCYRREPALHVYDTDPQGFEWVDCNDHASGVLAFLRRGPRAGDRVLVICHFTPVLRSGYRLGVPERGVWQEILNSDAGTYGGSGRGNLGRVVTGDQPFHGRPCSLHLSLPPLSVSMFKWQPDDSGTQE